MTAAIRFSLSHITTMEWAGVDKVNPRSLSTGFTRRLGGAGVTARSRKAFPDARVVHCSGAAYTACAA